MSEWKSSSWENYAIGGKSTTGVTLRSENNTMEYIAIGRWKQEVMYMNEMKEIEKNEETGTPGETTGKPLEEPPILPSIEDVVIGYQVKKPIETQAECDVYSVVVAAVTKHNETAVSGDYYWMIADLDDCYEVQQHEPVPSEDMMLESLKTSKISQSKIALSTFLSLHPIQWSDGKYYSVTSEKQALLTSNLALYQISTAAGQPFKLT